MAFSNTFEKTLDSLFHRRTYWLRSIINSKRGQPPKFGRREVDKGIGELQQIASNALSHKLARVEFKKHITIQKRWHIKGHGRTSKRQIFIEWFDKNFDSRKGYIYILWGNRNKCIYVGRAGRRGGRPTNHFDKQWFGGVKYIYVFPIRARSQIPKIECLAIHHFQPRENINKAATRKWTKACPLCKIHRLIERDLRNIFRLKR